MDHLERLAEAKKRGIISAELTELVNNFLSVTGMLSQKMDTR